MSCFCRFRNIVHIFRANAATISTMSKPNKATNVCKNKQNFGCNATNLTSKNTFNTQNVNFCVLPSPVKSDSDKKDYKVIRLENGLIACLIADKSPLNEETCPMSEDECESTDSDESVSEAENEDSLEDEDDESFAKSNAVEQKMAAAALCVGVGSFSDPKEVPGMAHFLEHMVFMGSEKFPAENDFDAFIKKGGGSDNASTDTETTVFYFECLEKNLYEALDKFAQFFISPLMKREAMTREREAIESEFQMSVQSDSSRKEQLLFSLAKTDSPVNSFAWGNLITLRDNISDDSLYKGVHEFRNRHYSAHRMTLAIQARLPMEDLESYVLDCFSNVSNNNLAADDFSAFADQGIFNTAEFNKLYYVKPTKDLCQVDLTWALPCLRDKYKSKPHQYISYLMGDEGKGSLLSYLRKKVWVLGTSIGNGESGSEHNSMYAFFTVTMVLTEEGLANLYEVIEVVFSYINLLKSLGPQERIFNEIKTIAETAFKFSTEEAAVDLVEDLCESMQFYPPEDYIAGSELYYEYDPEAIKTVLNLLTPTTMNVMVTSNDFNDIEYDQVEKWFGTKYCCRDIPSEWLKRWETVKPLPELATPPPNPYLTNDFAMLKEIENHLDYPQKVIGTPLLEMWYRQDQKFKLPIAYYYFYLISPMLVESAKSSCMLDTLVNLLVIDITEEVYPATSADLSHQFSSYERGLMIKVSGFNEKLPVLMDVISKHLVQLGDNITKDMFAAVKDKLIKNYYNKLIKPTTLAKDIRLNLLVSSHWTSAERYSVMLGITFEEMQTFIKDFLKSLYMKCLVQGNVDQEIACKTVNKFKDTLQYKKLPENAYPKFRVVQLPNGEKCCRIKSFNPNDSNSIITNYYQSGPFSIKGNCIIELIMLIIEEPLFDILRTKEQLGYHVYCSIRDTFGILGYTVTVNAQATKNTAEYVDQRIEEFMKHSRKLLKATKEKDFDQTKGDLIKMKQCTDVHLKEEVDRNWSEIVSDDYMFDRLKQEIDAIDRIDIKEVRKWWDEHNSFGNKENFRKMSIQVVGHNKSALKIIPSNEEYRDGATLSNIVLDFMGTDQETKSENKSDDYFVQNIEDFKEKLFLYPLTTKKH